MVRLDREDRVACGDQLEPPLGRQQELSLRIESIVRAWLDREERVERGDRFLPPIQLHEGVGFRVQRARVARIERHDLRRLMRTSSQRASARSASSRPTWGAKAFGVRATARSYAATASTFRPTLCRSLARLSQPTASPSRCRKASSYERSASSFWFDVARTSPRSRQASAS